MAIGTDALIDFFGTQDLITHATTTGAITNNSFSVVQAADVLPWTNDDDAPSAIMVLKCRWTTTAPTDGTMINVHIRPLNVQSTNDTPVPTAVTPSYLTNFRADGDVAADTYVHLITPVFALPNSYTSAVYEFYLENKTGQSITTAWTWYITPVTKGPHG